MNQSLQVQVTNPTSSTTVGDTSEKDPHACSAEQVARLYYDRHYQGFSAETCGHCKATANVLSDNAGWFCVCGHYNLQNWSHHQRPHKQPDYGPSMTTILEGCAIHEREIADLIAREIPGWTAPADDKYGLARNELCQQLALKHGLERWSTWGQILNWWNNTERPIVDLIARERPDWTYPDGGLNSLAFQELRREFCLKRGLSEWCHWEEIIAHDQKLAA